MVVPLELDKGRHNPKSPYYEPTKSEQRQRREEERRKEAEKEHFEKMLKLKESDCRACGKENDNVKELCKECEL